MGTEPEPEIDPETGEDKIVPPGEESSPVRLISEHLEFEQIIDILITQYPEVEFFNYSQRRRVRRLTETFGGRRRQLTVEMASELVKLRKCEIEDGENFFQGYSRITKFLDLIKYWEKISRILCRSLHSAYDDEIVGKASGLSTLRELLGVTTENYSGLFEMTRHIPNFVPMRIFADFLKLGRSNELTESDRAELRAAFLGNSCAYSFLVEKFPQVPQICRMNISEHSRLTREYQKTCEEIQMWGKNRSYFGFED